MLAPRLYRPVAALVIALAAFLVGPGQVWAACCAISTTAQACCASPVEVDEAPAAIEGRCSCEVSSHDGPAPERRAPAASASSGARMDAPHSAHAVERPQVRVAISPWPPPVTWTPQVRLHLRNRVIQR